MGAHGWVAGIASHGSVSLSRGCLISVEAPRHPGHLSSIQLDAVVNVDKCSLGLVSLWSMCPDWSLQQICRTVTVGSPQVFALPRACMGALFALPSGLMLAS